MKKRLLIVFLVVACITVCSIYVAASSSDIMPRWNNTEFVDVNIEFTGTSGRVSASIIGDNNVSNITASVQLYYKNFLGIWVKDSNAWTYDVDQDALVIGESFTGKSGRQYKVELTGTVTKNGYAESVSASATAEC